MPLDQSFTVLLFVCAGLLAGAILFALSFRFNLLLLLAGIFIVITPFSLVFGPVGTLLKYARIGCAVAMIVVGALGRRRGRFGRASVTFLPFAAVFSLSALWSATPIEAAIYKFQFGLLTLAGLLAGTSLRNETSLRQGTRLLMLASVVWGGIIGADLFANPTSIGRLSSYGLNANGIGVCSAFCALFSLYPALFDRSRFIKAVGYCSAALQVLITVSTGSRGAVLMLVLSGLVMMFPLLKQPKRVIGVGFALAFLGVIVWILVNPASAKHLTDLGTDRAENWGIGLAAFAKSPFWGCGWLAWGRYGTTYNTHMAYIQILAEAGLIGLVMFAASLFALTVANMQNYIACVNAAVSRAPVFLAASLLTAVLVDGACYIGPAIGSSMDLLILVIAIGLVDQIPHLIAEEQAGRTLELSYASLEPGSFEADSQWDAHDPYNGSGIAVPAFGNASAEPAHPAPF